MRLKFLLVTWLLTASMALAQQTPAPAIFFTDLTSGPATGNSDTTYSATGGVYVTLYGNNFGSTPGTVTLNGASCLTVVSWGTTWMWYQKIVVKLGTSCTSGAFSVTVGGQASNCADIGNQGANCQFTVRSGNIYYVSTSGNDSTGTGSFSKPWATFPHARDTIAAGDTVYGENGTCACADDGSGWQTFFLIDYQHGNAGSPMAIVAYPGATVTFGNTTSNENSTIRTKGNSGSGGTNSQSYWVFAGLYVKAYTTAFSPNLFQPPNTNNSLAQAGGWRIIGDDITCPNGNGESGCLDSAAFINAAFLGNNSHDMGVVGGNSEYQGIYWSSDGHDFEVGWDTIYNSNACRGFQTNSSENAAGQGQSEYNFTIHDSLIYTTACDAMVLNDVDPSLGFIRVYNNVVYNAGTTSPPNGSGAWNCVYAPGASENGWPTPNGSVEVYNNTFYNCGPNTGPPYPGLNACVANGGHSSTLNIHMRNNVCYQTGVSSYQMYYIANSGSGTNGVYGLNNIMYGLGAPPSSGVVTGTINSNPLFVSTSTANFHLQSGSPAIGAGDSTGLVPTYDHDGLLRPSTPSIGAYEFAAGTGGGAPSPPTNLKAIVN